MQQKNHKQAKTQRRSKKKPHDPNPNPQSCSAIAVKSTFKSSSTAPTRQGSAWGFGYFQLQELAEHGFRNPLGNLSSQELLSFPPLPATRSHWNSFYLQHSLARSWTRPYREESTCHCPLLGIPGPASSHLFQSQESKKILFSGSQATQLCLHYINKLGGFALSQTPIWEKLFPSAIRCRKRLWKFFTVKQQIPEMYFSSGSKADFISIGSSMIPKMPHCDFPAHF